MRTTDVDFLVGMPPKVRREFDVPAALLELGFEPEWALQGGYCKYVHPEMEVEFLIPEQARRRWFHLRGGPASKSAAFALPVIGV